MHNSKRIGIFKDEAKGKTISLFCTTGSKCYIDENRELGAEDMIKIKSVPKYVQKSQITGKDFVKAVMDPASRKTVEYSVIRLGENRKLYTVKCIRKTLNSNDSKRYVIKNGLDSLALGHYLTLNN